MMRAPGLWRLMMLLLMLCPAAWPQEPIVHVLLVDATGRWQVERQERFVVPSDCQGVSSDWKQLTSTKPFRRLSYNDRIALLAYPERLLASSWAEQIFAGRQVLVLRPVGPQRVQGRLFDLSLGRDQPVMVANSESDSPRRQALAMALEKAGVNREPVLAHPEGLYHRTSAAHLSEKVHYEPVESARRAEVFGFSPCGICYAQASRDPLYDDFDRGLGELVASQIESNFPLLEEGEQTDRVRRVGERILRQNRFLDQGYRFEVLDTETFNAYCAPTGPVYITRGLLEALETDDELAAVIGHELSHSERKHARRQYEQAQQTGILGLAVTLATGFPWASLGTDIVGTVLVRGYSRGYELEADRDGMMAAYAAGYDPAEYLRVQDKLEEVQRQRGGGGIDWLRTHPRGDERKRQLDAILEQIAPLRQRLDAIELRDPGLAVYLKSQLLLLSDDQTAVGEYLDRYESFARALEIPEVIPETLESTPETLESTPETLESAPETLEGTPETLEGTPETLESAPETLESTPEAAPEELETMPPGKP
jgi:hypothetical protein